jgi:hypothetical protein
LSTFTHTIGSLLKPRCRAHAISHNWCGFEQTIKANEDFAKSFRTKKDSPVFQTYLIPRPSFFGIKQEKEKSSDELNERGTIGFFEVHGS